jgi:thiol:disulfide interchange protein DsbC
MKKIIILLLSSLVIYFADAASTDQIAKNLKIYLPDLIVDQINPTVIPNVYEVVSGHKIFYIDSTGRYLMLGNLVDLSTKQSITETRVNEISDVKFSSLPLNLALKQVIGNGERKIAVFTDPDCPFCQRLEQDTVPKLSNVTIYYFLFPLAIHANAETDSKKILCAENPDKTFLLWMKNSINLPNNSSCNASAKLAQMQKIGVNVVGVEATPTIVLQNGKVIKGLPPADYLNQLITDAMPKANKNISIESSNLKL